MPPSYLRLKVFYFSGGGGDAGAGVAIEKNAILSHNHHLFSSQTPADIRYIVIEDASGNLIYTARAGEFLMAEDTELGGGLSLFVLKTDLFKEWALLGDVDELEPGMRADQDRQAPWPHNESKVSTV
jgi:hypothetical protein